MTSTMTTTPLEPGSDPDVVPPDEVDPVAPGVEPATQPDAPPQDPPA